MDALLSRFPPRLLSWGRILLPAAGAVLFLVLWTVAEAGRTPLAAKEVMFLLWAGALALAGWRPRIALAAILAIPILVALGGLIATPFFALPGDYEFYVLPAMDWQFSLSTSWPAWFAAPILIGYVAAIHDGWRLRIVSLVIGVVSAVGYAALLLMAGWISWTGGGSLRIIVGTVALLVVGLIGSVVIAWLIGIGLAALWRVRIVTGRLETATAQLDDVDLELRLAHDRGRISRDVHDSLAHSLAIVVAQAEGAAAIHPLKPEAAPESLANIAAVARHALGEVRRLVERINDAEDLSEHTSRLEHLPALIEDVRSAGVDASLRTVGTIAPLSLSKQVAVYRIVQESLTNALKHGGRGTSVTVTLDAQGAGLAVLAISNSGAGEPLVLDGGRGIGIAGMKERARLVGGWLTAVPGDDRTFVVTAFIPPDALAVDAPPQPLETSDVDAPVASAVAARLAIAGNAHD